MRLSDLFSSFAAVACRRRRRYRPDRARGRSGRWAHGLRRPGLGRLRFAGAKTVAPSDATCRGFDRPREAGNQDLTLAGVHLENYPSPLLRPCRHRPRKMSHAIN
jgi:hypothetical protein